jgi:uncharacterized protein with gpF-like domain
MLIVSGDIRRARQGWIRLKPLRPPTRIEGRIRAALNVSIDHMRREVEVVANSGLEPRAKYQRLWTALDTWQKRFEELGDWSGNDLFAKTFDHMKRRLLDDIYGKLKLPVDLMFDGREFSEMMECSAAEYTALIRSIPGQYIEDVTKALLTHERQQPQPEGRTLWQQIQHVGGVTRWRARFIARDQTAKMSSAISEFQCEQAGIDRYIWRTSRDIRVVGTPGGLYPKGSKTHMDHYSREGKIFRWSDPPPDGHPGEPINCRCWAQGVLNLSRVA